MSLRCRLPGFWSLVVLGLWLGAWPGQAQDVTEVQRYQTAFAAERSFEYIVELWKDKRFGDLYTFGTFASRVDISPEAFTRYMAQATRTLQCCWATLRDISSRFDTLERIYVQGRLGFKNKEFLVVRGRERFIARGFLEEETLTFLMQFEDQAWRIDLFRILALSGIALEIPHAPFYFGRPFPN